MSLKNLADKIEALQAEIKKSEKPKNINTETRAKRSHSEAKKHSEPKSATKEHK